MYDKIVVNGIIYSLEQESQSFEAMAIDKGRIVKLFDKEPLNPNSLGKRVIDAQGCPIIPGFIDTHFHFMSTAALQEIALNVHEVHDGLLLPKNLQGFKDMLIQFAAQKKADQPILCFNYIIPAMKEDRLPYTKELEEWVPNRLIIIISMDGHSSCYSRKALQIMGHNPDTHNGILSGEDHEFNMGKVTDLVMKHLSIGILIKGVQNLINEAASYGLVGIQCLDGFDELKKDSSLWFLSQFGGMFPVQLWLSPQLQSVQRVYPYAKKMSYPRMGGCGVWEQDGSIGSQTAAFYDAYANNSEYKGRCYYSLEEMTKYVGSVDEAGFQLTSHAIGTAAIDVILGAFEKVLTEKQAQHPEDPINPLRHRIDHFEFPSAEQVDNAVGRLNLLITAQPGYSWMDETFQKAYRNYLTPSQFNRQIPLKTIIQKGGIICGSSDSPVQHLNPFTQLHGMINFPLQKEQLSVYEALRTYTYNGAYSVFEEHQRGTLSTGKRADFICLDRDPFKIPKNEFIDLKVKQTYILGEKFKPLKYSTGLFLLKGLFGRKHKI